MLTTFTNRGRTIQIGRAPKGGIEFGGKVYRAGQFCPIAALPLSGGAPATAEGTIEVIGKCEAVESIKPWSDRHYINLEGASRRFRGDSTCKTWVDHKGRLVIERGKGTRSDAFATSLEALEAYAAEHGIEIKRPI